MAEPADAATHHGRVVVRLDLAGTAVFAATAILAATVFDDLTRWIAAITAMALFAVGVFAFLWSYYNAVQRSRVDEIAVSQLYLLVGPAIVPSVRRTMLFALAAQVVIALTTALSRPSGPDGGSGSSLALGVLVPMFGIGLNGLWAAYHGRFTPRVTTTVAPIDQNADHG